MTFGLSNFQSIQVTAYPVTSIAVALTTYVAAPSALAGAVGGAAGGWMIGSLSAQIGQSLGADGRGTAAERERIAMNAMYIGLIVGAMGGAFNRRGEITLM